MKQIQTHAVMLVLTIMLTFAYATGVAQTKPFATAGTVELSGTVAFSSIAEVSNGRAGDATSLLSLAPQIGYFVSDGFEIGVGTGVALLPGISVISPPRGNGTTITQLFVTPSYNFRTEGNSVVPFIEGQLGYTSASSGSLTESGFSYGGRGGIKFIPVEHFLLTFSAQYLAITLNPERATERYGFNYLNVGVGVGGYF